MPANLLASTGEVFSPGSIAIWLMVALLLFYGKQALVALALVAMALSLMETGQQPTHVTDTADEASEAFSASQCF